MMSGMRGMTKNLSLYSRCVALINGSNYYEKAKQGKMKGNIMTEGNMEVILSYE